MMTGKLRVFVSSVQKEIEDERLVVQNLLSTDPFLAAHCVPVLYEFEPASPTPAVEGCLRSLDRCQVYVLIVGVQYGTPVDGLPAVEAQLSARQRKIMAQAVVTGSVTTGWCIEALGVARDTAHRDLVALVERDLLLRVGSGRGVRYVPRRAGNR